MSGRKTKTELRNRIVSALSHIAEYPRHVGEPTAGMLRPVVLDLRGPQAAKEWWRKRRTPDEIVAMGRSLAAEAGIELPRGLAGPAQPEGIAGTKGIGKMLKDLVATRKTPNITKVADRFVRGEPAPRGWIDEATAEMYASDDDFISALADEFAELTAHVPARTVEQNMARAVAELFGDESYLTEAALPRGKEALAQLAVDLIQQAGSPEKVLRASAGHFGVDSAYHRDVMALIGNIRNWGDQAPSHIANAGFRVAVLKTIVTMLQGMTEAARGIDVLLTVPHGAPGNDLNADEVGYAIHEKLLANGIKSHLLVSRCCRYESADMNREEGRGSEFRSRVADVVEHMRPQVLVDVHSFPPLIPRFRGQHVVLLRSCQEMESVRKYAMALQEAAPDGVSVGVAPSEYPNDLCAEAVERGQPKSALVLVEHSYDGDPEVFAEMHIAAVRKMLGDED